MRGAFSPLRWKSHAQRIAKTILHSLVPTYEKFHFVKYDSEAVDACVDLSLKFIHDRHLPDKAIDLLDQAGSKVKIANMKRPARAKVIESKLEKLMAEEDEAPTVAKKTAIANRQEKLFLEYKSIVEKWSKSNEEREFRVTLKDIYELLAQKLSVPVEQVSSSFVDQLLNLESDLKKNIIGQPQALCALSQALVRNRAGLRSTKGPIGSFLLLGGSGVGKTHTAKTLAKTLFGSKDNFIKINMTEYSDSFTSSKLIGAAPGYVGYDQAGQLTEAVRKSPYSVVLFDEIEKAHENVIQMLLQILDDGFIRDNMGRDINFRQCIIIITGNVGSEFARGKSSMIFTQDSAEDYEAQSERVKEAAKKRFPPEFINRLDDIIVFRNFNKADYFDIVKLHLDELKSQTKKENVDLRVFKSASELLTQLAITTEDGARPIERLIQARLATPIAHHMLSSPDLSRVHITASEEEFLFKYS